MSKQATEIIRNLPEVTQLIKGRAQTPTPDSWRSNGAGWGEGKELCQGSHMAKLVGGGGAQQSHAGGPQQSRV